MFAERLYEHFGQAPHLLPVVSESFEPHDQPNVHVAIDDYVTQKGRHCEILGARMDEGYGALSIAALTSARSEVTEAPVEYKNIPVGDGKILACIHRGLYLIREGDRRLAVLVQGPHDWHPMSKFKVEAMGLEQAEAERFLSEVRFKSWELNCYRGRTLSLSCDRMGQLQIAFHRLPAIHRDSIVLPQGLLDRIEQHTIRFGLVSAKLRAAGRHLKRGLLLHGPPGTGKTLTAMYLAQAMHGRTILLLKGRGLGLIEQSCSLARALQPSMVVLEDVDLVAEERTRREPSCATPLLFELLNEMDGLSQDCDVLFVLTTNRPELLEPALAARPGRIDQAIEIPLPDDDCRHRLINLYAIGLTLLVNDLPHVVARTAGASAAFIREMMRKAALFAVDERETIVVEDRHLDEAILAMVVHGGELTKMLLGYRDRGNQ